MDVHLYLQNSLLLTDLPQVGHQNQECLPNSEQHLNYIYFISVKSSEIRILVNILEIMIIMLCNVEYEQNKKQPFFKIIFTHLNNYLDSKRCQKSIQWLIQITVTILIIAR